MILSLSANFFPSLPEMQYRYTLPVKKDVLRSLDRVVRATIFIAVILYLVHHFHGREVTWHALMNSFTRSTPHLLAVLLLMPVNLSLESLRWKYILDQDERVSFRNALQGVLAGLAFGLVTPRAIGDYAGRLMSVRTSEKAKYVGPLMISRVSLLMWTLAFGSLGAWFMLGKIAALVCFLAGPVTLLTCYILVKSVQFPGRPYVEMLLRGLKDLGWKQLGVLSGLGFLRYLVFSLQFYFLLSQAVPLEPVLIAGGIAWIFLAKSVLPSINFLGDLGVREFSAVYFFSFFAVDTAPVIASSLLIWSVNIAIPALAGSILLLKNRTV